MHIFSDDAVQAYDSLFENKVKTLSGSEPRDLKESLFSIKIDYFIKIKTSWSPI